MAKVGEFVWARKRGEFILTGESFPTRQMAIEAGFLGTANRACYYTGLVYEFRFADDVDLSPLIRDFEHKAIAAGVPYQEITRYVDSLDDEDVAILRSDLAEAAKEIFPSILAVTKVEWHWHTEMQEGKEGHPLVSENRILKETVEKLNQQLAERVLQNNMEIYESGKYEKM